MIRTIKPDDLEQIHNIETEISAHPWTLGIFQDCLRVGYECYLLEEANEIIGFIIISMAVDEAHVLNVAVKSSQQRKGYGKQLLNHLFERVKNKKLTTIFLEVRASNKAAIALYQQCGFKEDGVRNNYYPIENNKREDAVLMSLLLD